MDSRVKREVLLALLIAASLFAFAIAITGGVKMWSLNKPFGQIMIHMGAFCTLAGITAMRCCKVLFPAQFTALRMLDEADRMAKAERDEQERQRRWDIESAR